MEEAFGKDNKDLHHVRLHPQQAKGRFCCVENQDRTKIIDGVHWTE